MAGNNDQQTKPALEPIDGLNDSEVSELFSGVKPESEPAKDAALADTHAEAAAAEPDDQAASRDAKTEAAPEAAKPEKKPGHKKTAKERAAEINAEADAEERAIAEALERRARARERRREAEREDEPKRADARREAAAPAKPDPTVPGWKKYREMPDAPKSSEFENLDDYAAAMGYFIAEKVAKEQAEATYTTLSTKERESVAQVETWGRETAAGFERAQKELEAEGDLLDRIDPRMHALKPIHELERSGEQMTVAHYIKDQVLRRAQSPLRVLAELSANDSAELKRIGRLRPDAIAYELGRIDARLSPSGDAQDDEAEVAKPSRVSNADAPAPTLGKKPAPGRDPRKPPSSYDDFDNWNLEETRAATAAK